MRILLVRHAETEGNRKGIFLGSIDESLNENGRKQAEKLAKRLKKEKIDVIFSSKLKRAKETAEIINKYHNLPIKFDELLKERNFGIFQGRPKEEFFNALKESGKEFHEFLPEKGESCQEVQNRSIKFFNKVVKKYQNKTVLVVTHASVIVELLFYLTKLPREEFKKLKQDKASLNIIEVTKNKEVKVKVINDTKHLKK
ncbi:MAG: histidine phosphatase family protein [Candidatus Aenigmatarchaeota archaeon]